MFLIAISLFNDRFIKLFTKIFGLISYLVICLKDSHLVKNSLFISNLCKCSTTHISLYPLIRYFLPEIFLREFRYYSSYVYAGKFSGKGPVTRQEIPTDLTGKVVWLFSAKVSENPILFCFAL